MIQEALLLGLSTGTYCIMFCSPIALPFLFSENIDSGRKNILYVGLFLLGRLIAYIGVGMALGAIGAYAIGYIDPPLERILFKATYFIAGVFMLATGLMYNFPTLGFCKLYKKIYNPSLNALLFGIVTGLSLCPPFFAAASRVFGGDGALYGGLYFLFFFLGTSVYFIPLLGIQFINKYMDKIRMISRITLILMGVYFILFLVILG